MHILSSGPELQAVRFGYVILSNKKKGGRSLRGVKQVSYSMIFLKAVNEAELSVSLADMAPLIASGNQFVTIIVQQMYCLVLCSDFSGMHLNIFGGVCPTKIYMLKSPLLSTHNHAAWPMAV